MLVPAIRFTPWHTLAARLLEAGSDTRAVQELLAHQDVSTAVILTQVLYRAREGLQQPLATMGGVRMTLIQVKRSPSSPELLTKNAPVLVR